MILPIIALVVIIVIIVTVITAAFICAITSMRSECKERRLHLHNLAWPFRVVETMDGKYRVQQYVKKNIYFEWVEANRFDNPDDAKRYCIEHTAIVMKNRYGEMTKEDMELMNELNGTVKQVVSISDMEGQVCSFMKESKTLPDLDSKDIEYLTSKEFVITHGVK